MMISIVVVFLLMLGVSTAIDCLFGPKKRHSIVKNLVAAVLAIGIWKFWESLGFALNKESTIFPLLYLFSSFGGACLGDLFRYLGWFHRECEAEDFCG